MRVHVTPEIMTKVWKLHNKGVDENLIAETLGISYGSAHRIVFIMTTAQNGGDVDSIGGTNHAKQKAFAKKYFGIEDKVEEVEIEEKHEEVEEHVEQTETECQTDITKDFMQRVLLALAWQNELLERLLDSLGVDWKTLCKGVERR